MTINELNSFCTNTLVEHLGIEFIAFEDGILKAKMPVDERTLQPMQLLHGGASLALAETLGSALSVLTADMQTQVVKGMSVTANHVSSVKSGEVFGEARFIHQGKNTHVTEVNIYTAERTLVSSARVTNFIDMKR